MGDQSADLEKRDCCCRDTDEATSAATEGKSGKEKGANCFEAINKAILILSQQNIRIIFLVQK